MPGIFDFLRSIRMTRDATFNSDGMLTIHNADFAKTPAFSEAYDAGESTKSWLGQNVGWRMHVICWAAAMGLKRPGDFVECGVSRGGSALTVLKYTNLTSTDRKMFLLDTFQGPSPKYMTKSEQKQLRHSAQYEDCLDQVRQTFAPFGSTVQIIPGPVPETLGDVTSQQIAYLSIDMNNTLPEIAAIEFFWPKLVPGAPVVLDDYGWKGHHEQKEAFDSFAARANVPILSLPTGQAVLIKA
jgi:hypothetical protein